MRKRASVVFQASHPLYQRALSRQILTSLCLPEDALFTRVPLSHAESYLKASFAQPPYPFLQHLLPPHLHAAASSLKSQ